MWYGSDSYNFDGRYSESDQYVKTVSMQLMKEVADSINTIVKEKAQEREQEKKECSSDNE